MLRNSFVPTQLLRKLPQQSKVCEIAPLRQYRYSATTGTKLRDNYNLLQKQSQVGFDPQKFALGFLGGVSGSVAVSKGFKLAKAKYYEKNFSKFIDDVNKQKHKIKPRFEITKELEKEFRENKVNASKQLLEKLHIEDKIYADYITLAQKHPEYFANPMEAKALTEYIAQNPSTAIPATKKDYELIFSEIKGGKGVFALDLELKGGKHRIRSLHLMKNSQYKKKLLEAKKLGEPVLQFSHVNSK